MKFVDHSQLEDTAKRLYTNLVRAQLSNFEVYLLFYNCVTKLGNIKFKPLVQKYALLKHFNFELALHGKSDRELYNPMAFGLSTNTL